MRASGAPDLVLISPCSGPVRAAAPAGVEAVVFALAEGLRASREVAVIATAGSELPDGVLHVPCDHADLAAVTGRLLARWPGATFCDHSGAALVEGDHASFFRVFHVEPRHVFVPGSPRRCGFVSRYLRGLFAAQSSVDFSGCTVLHNGVDPGAGEAHPEREPSAAGEGHPEREPSAAGDVVYVGRINALKGLDLGVAACAALGRRLHLHGGFGAACPSDIVFNDLALLDELARSYPDSFVYHGPLTEVARKRQLLASAAAVLVPSREAESCSLVALEAVACGAPVVTFERGGVVEYLGGHPGVHFAGYAGDAAVDGPALAEALRRALRAPRLGPLLPPSWTSAAMVERYRAWMALPPARGRWWARGRGEARGEGREKSSGG